jgi:hypothetical protein
MGRKESDMYTPSKHYLDFYIAGFTYWDGLDAIGDIKLGTEVILKGEPDNPYDPEAVAIFVGDHKIGYMPKDRNAEISKFLYFGHSDVFEAKISSIFPDKHPEQQFRVTVKIKEKII